jgi:hypothetical protein
MGAPLAMRTDIEAAELRRLARRERDGRVAARLIALANVLVSMRPEFSSEARFEISPGKLPVISRCWDLASSLSVAGRGA